MASLETLSGTSLRPHRRGCGPERADTAQRSDDAARGHLPPRTDGAPTAGRRWTVAGAAAVGAILAILLWYGETAASIVEIWSRSETFAHGYLVPPLCLYLIWRRRSILASLAPRPAYGVLVLLAGAGLMWLLGASASVLGATQFALVLMIQLAVWTLLGTQVTRAMTFPLVFLFFAVPFGEFMIPYLMEWTGNFTVSALRLSGVPVYREGLYFIIPSGRWSIVEACSGLRYLIASVMVGSLYAHLFYRSPARRWTFVGVSVAVPLVANWFRAYIIVMLGHVSGNSLAVGVDHLIYGWFFFGAVITLMFWIGARWREDAETGPAAAATGAALTRQSTPGAPGHASWAAALAAVLLAAAIWRPLDGFLDSRVASAPPRLASVPAAAGWSSIEGRLAEWRPGYRNPRAEQSLIFTHNGAQIGLFLGYYRGQSQESKLITSTNRLIAPQDRTWMRVGEGRAQVALGSEPLAVRSEELRGPGGNFLAWQWYWIDGRWTANEYLARAYLALARLLGRGDDAAVVVVYTAQLEGAAETQRLLSDFVAAHRAPLGRTLDEARHR